MHTSPETADDRTEGKPETSTQGEMIAAEVNGLLDGLRSTVASGDLNGVIQPLVSAMGKIMVRRRSCSEQNESLTSDLEHDPLVLS